MPTVVREAVAALRHGHLGLAAEIGPVPGDGVRSLEATVPAGGETRVELRLVPPEGASPATLRVGLAEDGVDWLLFADRPFEAPSGAAVDSVDVGCR